MSDLRLFKHYATYQYAEDRLKHYAYRAVFQEAYNKTLDHVTIVGVESDEKFELNKQDGNHIMIDFCCSENVNIYSFVDIENENNYIYKYDANTNNLSTKFLIIYKYNKDDKMYYVTVKQDKYAHTLAIFDSDLEGGKHLIYNKLSYYNVGPIQSSKPVYLDKYRAYIKSEQNKINAKFKEFATKTENNLKFLDSLLIEQGDCEI